MDSSLIWKPLVLYGESTNYIISEKGDVYNKLTKNLLTQFTDNSGRYTVCLSINGRTIVKRVHYLVYIAFYGSLEKNMTINHIDENFQNNYYLNLEPLSRRDNCLLYRKHNGIPKKQYSDQLIEEICIKLKDGIYYKDIAALYNMPIQFLYNIVKGKRRKFIVDRYLPFPETAYKKKIFRKIPHEMIDSLICQGYSNEEIYDILQLEINSANRNVLVRSRTKLNIPEPRYFSKKIIEEVTSLICSGNSNNDIYLKLNLEKSNRNANLIARLRHKLNILNFNPNGISLDTQNKICQDILLGLTNKSIKIKYSLDNSPYITNMLGRLRQKCKSQVQRLSKAK